MSLLHEYRSFVLRRLHSLSGVVPIGLFLLEHMWTNSFATRGPAAYDQQVEFLRSLPYVVVLEAGFIWIPILFHAFYGFYVMITGKSNLRSYPSAANWLYLMQRITGVITFAFVCWHVWETRIASDLFGYDVNFNMMVGILKNPWIFWFYVLGIASVMFHFGNGLWGFLVSWGITVGPRSQRIAGWASFALGLILFFVGVDALRSFVG